MNSVRGTSPKKKKCKMQNAKRGHRIQTYTKPKFKEVTIFFFRSMKNQNQNLD